MGVENLEYLNLNSLRSYPIRDGLSRVDNTGQFLLPNDFIVDISLAASGQVTDRFYVSSIFNQLTSFIVEISDENAVVVGTFTVLASTFTEYTTYTLTTATGIYSVATGRMTVGSINTMLSSPTGLYQFSMMSAEIEPKCIIPSLEGVSSITFQDNQGNLNTLTGNVNIIARTNLQFTYDSESNTLTIDAGQGLGLNTNCTTPAYVKMINGVSPDVNGNISFDGVGCTSISSPAAATLLISDECCTPCSGCDDLAELTTRLTELENNYLNIKYYYQFLNIQLNTYLSTVNSNCVCP